MKIQFLWWRDCPSHPKAWERLQNVLADIRVETAVECVEVTTDEQAERLRFRGSPTILVDGNDIDPNASQLPSRLTCRLYFKEDGRPSPVPSKAMIKRALLNAQHDR